MATMTRRFWKFHRLNPDVYTQLLDLAMKVRNNGRDTFAIESLFGALRWYRAIETKDDSGFKLNDHYTAFYARLMMARVPALVDFFRVRISEADLMFEHPDAGLSGMRSMRGQ